MHASPFRSLATAVLFLALCSGCGKETSTGPPPDPGTDRLVSSADSILALVLYDELSSNPQRPSDVDFRPAYNYYAQAYQSSELTAAGRVRARFGLAVLGLLILTSDAEVNSAFDAWQAYLQSRVPFEITPSPRAPLGIPAGFTSARKALHLPFDVVPLSLVAFARSPLGEADPQLSRVQAILRERALPRLTEAIAHLDAVGADAGFTFIVTPAMQGDLAADPVEIDHTDILALRAGCRLLSAACRVAVAYTLNFPAYDEASLFAAIQPGSHWLSLASGGAGQMGLARLDLLGSVDDVSAAIGSLLTESDPQDDDVIRAGPGNQAGLDSLRTRLPQVRQGLTGGYTLTADWDGSAFTPDVPLTVHPGALFTNPVPDWKAMLPDYTGSTVHRAASTHWVYDYNVSDFADITADTDGFYSGSYSLYVFGGSQYEYPYGDPGVFAGLRNMIQARYASAAARSDWAGGYSAYCSFSGNLTPGLHSVKISIPVEGYSLAGRTVAVPVITWVATQFSEWTWPDPTFRGLLPDLTTTNQLLGTFGITAQQWEREVILDWTRYYPIPPPPPGPARGGLDPVAARRGF